MNEVRPLSPVWKDRLGLASRRAPEFYESAGAVVDTPHALAIRSALDDLGPVRHPVRAGRSYDCHSHRRAI
jgi:hypothetical protein